MNGILERFLQFIVVAFSAAIVALGTAVAVFPGLLSVLIALMIVLLICVIIMLSIFRRRRRLSEKKLSQVQVKKNFSVAAVAPWHRHQKRSHNKKTMNDVPEWTMCS